MITAYKVHSQFIFLLIILYVIGVWGGPIIYVLLPLMMLLLGLKNRFFEIFIIAIWMLILSDYVPVKSATHDDLQFAKDLKPLIPILFFLFYLKDRQLFGKVPKVFIYFVPFFISATISLFLAQNMASTLPKTVSFILLYSTVPIFVVFLHRTQKMMFWQSLMTFIIGMLTIGIVLRFVAPDIANISSGRFKGIFGNPNGVGLFLNLVFVLWIVLREYGLTKFTRLENRYIFGVILISLIWSGSRNAMMSIMIFYFVYKIIKINWFLALLMVAAIVILSDPFFELLIDIIEFFGLQEFFRIESIEEGSGRKVAWVFGWQQVEKYYFFGGGFGYAADLYAANYSVLSRLGHEGNAHNSYLTFWLNTGIIGVILYFGGLLTAVIKAMKKNYLVIAFFICICFNIMYESWLVASLNPFTIIFLTILTIFIANLRGEDYSPVSIENSPKESE
ncbi:O-antigen ligase family protein [Crocinitomix catalasitica]|uniref:O-antigen ligase family protein n=1 Tax=Crocinitomix catalasitica TaxID=184607 RepID=UPI0004826ECE|nr:O-antigen ligase family protein [Crocinitomix catalasitica]